MNLSIYLSSISRILKKGYIVINIGNFITGLKIFFELIWS